MTEIVIPKLQEITIGTDPEFFLKNKSVYIPAEVTGIEGTKKSPAALPSGGAVQIDGLALEFNIQPQNTAEGFSKAITASLDDIRKIVDSELDFDFTPCVTFRKQEFDSVSAENRRLGCDPDFDAYSMEEKTPPAGSDEKPFRTAAGHIHIGFTKDRDPRDPRHIYDCSMIAQNLDQYLGRWEFAWAKQNDRANLYGQLGSFRPKPYGLEYRVLGNDWLKTPELQEMVFMVSREVTHRVLSGCEVYPLNRMVQRSPHYPDYHFVCVLAGFSKPTRRAIREALLTNPNRELSYDARWQLTHGGTYREI